MKWSALVYVVCALIIWIGGNMRAYYSRNLGRYSASKYLSDHGYPDAASRIFIWAQDEAHAVPKWRRALRGN